jgi:hypothetical protein
MRIEHADALKEIERRDQKIGALMVELDDAREQTRLSDLTISEAAELLDDDIVDEDVAIDALVLQAIERVIREREDARALAVRLEQEVARPHSEIDRLKKRLEAVERERDEWGGKAATHLDNAITYRRERDEARQALSQLVGSESGVSPK